MSELGRNSTIKEIMDRKLPLRSLRTILSVRDTTIKEVFNGLGYFYDTKAKIWVNESETPQENLTFQEALNLIKGEVFNNEPRKSRSVKEPKKTIHSAEFSVKSETAPPVENEVAASDSTTQICVIPTPPSELIETNSNLNVNVEVLNAIGLSKSELAVLKEMISERMESVTASASANVNDIYSEVSRLKSRKRKNKTFYISEDLTQDLVEFAEDLNVKISQLVEVALIEMLSKYKTIIKNNSN